jgi:hypothetical protein
MVLRGHMEKTAVHLQLVWAGKFVIGECVHEAIATRMTCLAKGWRHESGRALYAACIAEPRSWSLMVLRPLSDKAWRNGVSPARNKVYWWDVVYLAKESWKSPSNILDPYH